VAFECGFAGDSVRGGARSGGDDFAVVLIRWCNLAIKLLTQYERLAEKYGVRLTESRLQELDTKRDSGIISSNDLPATLQRVFPGRFLGQTLQEVREDC
jgi:hypothetical protein